MDARQKVIRKAHLRSFRSSELKKITPPSDLLSQMHKNYRTEIADQLIPQARCC